MYCVLNMCHSLVLYCAVHTGGVVVDEEIGFTVSVCIVLVPTGMSDVC